IDGIDFMGNNFRRISSFLCEVRQSVTPTAGPSPTPTAAVNVTSCNNRGQLIQNKDGSSECFCNDYYQGDTCETPVCMNGGRLMDNVCLCKDGFSGNSCQDLKCMDNAGYTPFFSHPMLVLVVRIRQSMNNVIGQLVTELQQLKNYMTGEPSYLEDIAVVTFNNNKPEYKVFRSFTETIDFFLSQNSSSATDGNSCEDSVLSALVEVLDRGIISYRSPIYVISDAVPNDIGQMDVAYQLDSHWNSPIYFTLLTDPTDACGVNDIYAPGFVAMETLAKRSSGMVFLANATDFGQLFQAHMKGTFYRSHLMRSNDLPQCGSQLGWQALAVDGSIDKLHFEATGDDLYLILMQPDGSTVHPDTNPFFKTVQIGRNFFWEFNGAHIGQWTFQIISSAPTSSCSYRAFANRHFGPAYMDYRLFWGWTPIRELDAPFRQPHFQKEVSLAVHLEGYGYPIRVLPERVQAEVIIWATHDDKPELVFAANGVWRDGCEHQIYFPEFQCNHADEDLYFIVYVRDHYGNTIQRAGSAVCTKNQPTIAPPDGCLNGAVDLDGKCVCTPFWEGDKCEKRRCLNGGTPNGVVCECPPGHAGQSCEITTCTAQNPEHDFEPIRREMVFLIDTTMNNFLGLSQLHTYLPSIVNDIHSQNPAWISHYTIIGYNSNETRIYHLSHSNDTGAFATTLDKIVKDALDKNDLGCRVQMWQALDYAVTIAGQNGYVFLFQGALPDDSDTPRIIDVYNTVSAKRVMVNSYVSVKDQNTYFCEGTDDEFALLYEMSVYTEGETYGMLQSEFQNILRTIPALYSSGLVVRRKMTDCSSNPLTFYIPVDAFTQTLSITYFSTAPILTEQLYKPDGNAADDRIVTKIVNDVTAGVHVMEVRRPCDPDWDDHSQNQNCLKKVSDAATWTDAQNICSMAGGYLVDDMMQGKNDFLSKYADTDIWLGLNDRDTLGVFAWDRGSKRAAEPLSNVQYTQWADGSNLNDTNKRCVAWFASDQKWHVADCSETRAFICQKHKYTDSFVPNRLEESDDIPAGKWKFTLQTTLTEKDNKTATCYFEVRAQSSIQVYSGFTNDEHNDYPAVYPVSGSDKNRFITHLSGLTDRILKPRLTYSLLFDEKTFAFYNGVPYEQRELCAYPYASQTFVCPNSQDPMNAFAAVHVGEDEYGFAFQRVTSGHCRAVETSCENGGIVYKGECQCRELYTGPRCETLVCVNGGAFDPTTKRCECPKGFTGSHCDLGMCYQQSSNYISMQNDGKTFALVIENTQGNVQALKQLGADLSSIIDKAQAASPSQSWFSSYVLVTFDDKDAQVLSFGSVQQFLQAFKDKTAKPTTVDDSNGCQYPMYGALMRSMHSAKFVTPGSVIYLVGRGLPSDWENMNDFGQLLTDSQAQLYFTYIKDDVCGKLDPSTPHFMMLSSFAYGSDGNIFYIDSAQLGNHMQTYLPTIYDSQLLAVPTFHTNNCFQKTQNVLVDRTMDFLYITAHYDDFSTLSVIDPFGVEVEKVKMYVDQDKASFIYQVKTQDKPGIYTISINSSSSSCFVQIRGQHGVQVWLGFVYGESDPEHQDDPKYGPTIDAKNTLVAHEDPLNGVLTSMELYSAAGKDEVFISQLFPRYGCSFEYYSKSFTCIDSAFFVVINGMDADGQNFRRESLFECPSRGAVGTTTPPPAPVTTPALIPTTTPAPTRTNIKFDVLLFVDISGDVKEQTFTTDVVNFVMSTFESFDISRNGVNFGIFPVDGSDGYAPPMTLGLTKLGAGLATLKQALIDVTDYFDNSTGQTLITNLNFLTTNPNVFSDPLFNTISNKVIIYLTSTAKPSQAAIDKAKALRTAASNKIGFLAVAYPSDGSNADALKQFSGGDTCTFIANDMTTLSSVSTKIGDKIWEAALSPDNAYC
uniref:EGF-like domain-containing protein n=1 Tax=Steinernema glaseri TaxID=37863 RepID=A0A1I8AVF7_9BILA